MKTKYRVVQRKDRFAVQFRYWPLPWIFVKDYQGSNPYTFPSKELAEDLIKETIDWKNRYKNWNPVK